YGTIVGQIGSGCQLVVVLDSLFEIVLSARAMHAGAFWSLYSIVFMDLNTKYRRKNTNTFCNLTVTGCFNDQIPNYSEFQIGNYFRFPLTLETFPVTFFHHAT